MIKKGFTLLQSLVFAERDKNFQQTCVSLKRTWTFLLRFLKKPCPKKKFTLLNFSFLLKELKCLTTMMCHIKRLLEAFLRSSIQKTIYNPENSLFAEKTNIFLNKNEEKSHQCQGTHFLWKALTFLRKNNKKLEASLCLGEMTLTKLIIFFRRKWKHVFPSIFSRRDTTRPHIRQTTESGSGPQLAQNVTVLERGHVCLQYVFSLRAPRLNVQSKIILVFSAKNTLFRIVNRFWVITLWESVLKSFKCAT